MFAPVRWLIGLVVCLVVIGFCRGWFTITKVRENAAGDKVNLSVSVDTKKVEADAEKVKHRIEGEVVKGDKEAHNKVRDNMVRGEQARFGCIVPCWDPRGDRGHRGDGRPGPH